MALLLLAGVLAVSACPTDDVPADTEGVSTGETTEGSTTAGSTFTTTTTVDPQITTTTTPVDPDTTFGDEACDPACGADQCCAFGLCFVAPDPICEACGPQEVCRCPEGSDPCDCEASCVACGTETDGYDPCLGIDCPDGSVCVLDDPAAPTFGWCAQQGCGTDDCACPQPAEGATALPTCGAFEGDEGTGSCFLDCGRDAALCPEGMVCVDLQGERACVWPGEGIASNCCLPYGGLGCDDRECQLAVCDYDAFCCDGEWDEICVEEARQRCGGLCPIAGEVQPQYGDCINLGPCDVGLTCISDGTSTLGWCSTTGCMDDAVCQPPPATGDAPAICAPIDDATNACLLDCAAGQTCPDGMICFDGLACVWAEVVPPPPVQPAYGDCGDNPVETCLAGEDACLTDAGGTAAGCSQSGCADASECPAAPDTGDAPVACGDLGAGSTCYLDCAGGQTCPDGTMCTPMGAGSACLWPDDGLLLDEDFELGVLRPGWTVIDVDGNVPEASVSFVSDAFVVSDEFGPGANFGAYSTSWYVPPGMADDWLVTPQLVLGPSSELSWEAWAPDPDFSDGYEVRISTGMPTVADFQANPPLFTIADEADVLTSHAVDLAAAGYMNEAVYLAFRNDSTDEYVLVVDDVRVTE